MINVEAHAAHCRVANANIIYIYIYSEGIVPSPWDCSIGFAFQFFLEISFWERCIKLQ